MSMTATYSAEDNKLRLYSSARLDSETYARVKGAGFAWAPRQELFVAGMWTPEREDLLLELAGEIDDEDTPLADRATERAERFDGYHDKRSAEATSAHKHVEAIAGRFEFGQPILVGHHSERKARKDAERIQDGMRKAIRLWDTATYWESRASRVMRHAEYKANPRVRANRIKTLEADRRRHQREIAQAQSRAESWRKIAAYEDPQTQLAAAIALANHGSGDRWSKLKDGTLSPAQAVEDVAASCARVEAYAARWIAHLDNRLAYERVLLGRAPDEETKVDRTRRGAAALPLLNYRVERVETRNRWREGTESLRQVPMTGVEYGKIYADDKGTRVSADGTHRVRIAVIRSSGGSAGREFVAVFVGDTRAHPVPVPAPKASEPTAEEVEAEIADEEAEVEAQPADEAPEPTAFRESEPEKLDPFEAMRKTLKAGVRGVAVPELFVTPTDLAGRVAEEAGIRPGMTVLEPSAGLAALALAARARGGDVVCVEIALPAIRELERQGFVVHAGDFMTLDLGGQTFDRVVMNPPFSVEVEHVTRAWSMLRPGGRLVAIASASVKHRKDRATKAFRALVDEYGTIEDLPPGSFSGSGTGVNTVLISLMREAA